MRYTSLGSGSEGNALVVESAGAEPVRVLLDCGFGVRELTRRLALRALVPEALQAVLVTHEHMDHASGVLRLARRYGLPVYCSHGTWIQMKASAPDLAGEVRFVPVCSHTAFQIGALRVQVFPVPHDAREPTQFAFDDGVHRLGVATDLGSITPCVVEHLSGCDALVLETNHEPTLLAQSDYPAKLKARIAGPYGHLSNAAAGALLQRLDQTRLRRVHAAHLSQSNNQADLAHAALISALHDRTAVDVAVADQLGGFDWAQL